ncbi:MAG TPA: esterase-like activity of phytase family protein [Sphingomicrobium sp.]|nr:esterase-like activity of phytase family protein [Sphingomicrobium sp.]
MALIGLFARWLDDQPDQMLLPRRTVAIHFEPVKFDAARFAPLRLAGAWSLAANDPRFGGVSALAIDKAGLVAVTDAGAVIRFARPSDQPAAADIEDLPNGPGRPGYKRHRDAEALARDPAGRGWWVAFENHNQLWLYDRDFSRALERIDFGRRRWPRNKGIEAMLAEPGGLLLLPEAGTSVVRFRGSRMRSSPMANPKGRLSEAVRLPDGPTMVLARRAALDGFHNALVLLLPGDRLGQPIKLGLGPLDNAEALAVEPVPNGTRLWLMTDDNFRWPMRTLLVALDLPSGPHPQLKSN